MTIIPAARHLIVGLLLLGAAAGSVSAAAASLGGVETGGGIASGTARIDSCDAAMAVAYSTKGGRLTAVTVSGIADPACSGLGLAVRVLGADGAALAAAGPATVPTDGDTADDSVTLSVTDGPLAEAVAGAAISITGP